MSAPKKASEAINSIKRAIDMVIYEAVELAMLQRCDGDEKEQAVALVAVLASAQMARESAEQAFDLAWKQEREGACEAVQ